MQNCARLWSIRRLQLPRRSASSAVRRRMCSGTNAIVESAARVCGIDDLVLHLDEGNKSYSSGSIWFHSSTHWSRRDQHG